MDEVKVGDKLATVSPTVGSDYVEVVAWMHRDLQVMGDAVEIRSAAGTLQLTPDHLVFVESEEGKDPVTVPAHQVTVGHRIIAANGVVNVSSVNKTKMLGHMLPLTTSGDLLVDGMLASCYGEVGALSHNSINMLMAPVRSPVFPPWLRPQSDEAWSKYATFLKNLLWLLR